MKIKIKLFLAVVIVYIAFIVVPIFNQLIPLPPGVMSIVLSGAALVLFPKAFYQRVTLWVIIYFVVMELFVMSGKKLPSLGIGDVVESRRVIIEMAYLLPIVSILCVLNYLKDINVIAKIRFGSIILISISFVIIVSLVLANPGIMRVPESELTSNDVLVLGLPNYTLMHAYTFLVPGQLYTIRKAKSPKIKIPMLLFLLATLFVIVNTQITTAMVLVLFFLILFFLFDVNSTQSSLIKVGLILFALLVLHQMGFFRVSADFLVDFFDGTAAQSKMEDFQSFVYGYTNSESNLDDRESRHIRSFMALFDNILVGGDISKLGGHSYLMDRLGGMGLIGFTPFAILLYHMVRLSYQLLLTKEQQFYFIITIIALLVFMYEKGLFGQEGYLFSLILTPCLLTYLPQKKA